MKEVDIVQSLRNRSIFPIATASSLNPNIGINPEYGGPEVALEYSTDVMFHSDFLNNQYWMITFLKPVLLKSYYIMSGYQHGFLYNWAIVVIMNGEDWQMNIDSHSNTFPQGEEYQLDKIYKCVAFKLRGGKMYTGVDERIAFYYIKFFGYLINDAKSKNNNNFLTSGFLFIVVL